MVAAEHHSTRFAELPRGAGDWSREEEEAIVADYFAMLRAELRGEPYNKTEHRRDLQRIIPSRNDGSIERKHQNISSVLLELGYPYIDGYKPLSNIKASLRGVVLDRLAGAREIRAAANELVESTSVTTPALSDVLTILVPPPVPEKRDSGRVRERELHPVSALADFAERDQRNRALGLSGEELVLRYEHERLYRAGKKKLAGMIEHSSQKRGDHLGYDIRSFEEDGAPRLIEVKTTRLAAMTPFYATRNEVAVSDANRNEYHLYRLYHFTKQPRLFVLSGSLRDTCTLDPLSYIVRIA
jgi:hypothetical protein